MTLAQPNLFSDSFTSAGTTDSGSWQVKGGVVKIKITSSDQPLDVGCILKGTVTTAGIASPSNQGSVQCPDWSHRHVVRRGEHGD